MKNEIFEQSSVTVSVTFVGSDGYPFIPSTARYRVFDSDSLTELVTWQTFTPAATVEIDVSANASRILTDANSEERRTMIVQGNYGTDDQVTSALTWYIKNLPLISGTVS